MSQDNPDIDPFKAQSLMDALKEAQDTVRSYDTKAQIVGVGYIFAINIIQSFAASTPTPAPMLQLGSLRLLLVWLLVFVPIMMFARVLYPSRGTMTTLAKHVLYVPDAERKTVEGYKTEIVESDWLEEIATEIVKVSRLRDLKRRNFIQALWAAALSYFLMFVSVTVRGLSGAIA